jgi:N-acetylglutamate synthase-like GNAT family acetyltransferase
MESLTFRKATLDDASAIAVLINNAYRGDSSRAGWTTETDLLEGLRTNEAEVADLIGAEASMFLLCEQGGDMIGCVLLQKAGSLGYLGMLVVRPTLQNHGIGRRFIAEAEATARREWSVTGMTMQVITAREELIAYYERRGYRRTGQLTPFPERFALSVPKVPGLQFEILAKIF